MKTTDFNYDLPENLIADQPPKVRGTSNLLVLNRKSGKLSDKKYSDIVQYLNPGDVLVLNNTKVMKARIFAANKKGKEQEIIILEKHSTDNDWHQHKIMFRGKLSVGDELTIGNSIIKVNKLFNDGTAIVDSKSDLLELTEKYGQPPLPPYMHRDATPLDIERYQTVFAKERGSAAAPTASLNMTDDLLQRIKDKGIVVKYLTLHVGLGTFLPIRVDDVTKHKMHAEYFEIPQDTLRAIKNAKRIVALGTTVARTLEYAIPRNLTQGEADIFIYPGYKFQIVNTLITNFHAPKSTVLMFTAAFAGWDSLSTAYQHAVDKKYNFLSYGDSMLVY